MPSIVLVISLIPNHSHLDSILLIGSTKFHFICCSFVNYENKLKKRNQVLFLFSLLLLLQDSPTSQVAQSPTAVLICFYSLKYWLYIWSCGSLTFSYLLHHALNPFVFIAAISIFRALDKGPMDRLSAQSSAPVLQDAAPMTPHIGRAPARNRAVSLNMVLFCSELYFDCFKS